MAPSIRAISRVPGLKLKVVLAPRRVMVRSTKVNSLRDCAPVLTGVPSRIRSLSATGRGGAFSSTTLTSFTTWVTRAACSCTPRTEVTMAIVQIKADAMAMNFVCGVPANSFFILAGSFSSQAAAVSMSASVRLVLVELRCARRVAGICRWLWGRRYGWCINKGDLCAASEDDEVRGNVPALGDEL